MPVLSPRISLLTHGAEGAGYAESFRCCCHNIFPHACCIKPCQGKKVVGGIAVWIHPPPLNEDLGASGALCVLTLARQRRERVRDERPPAQLVSRG